MYMFKVRVAGRILTWRNVVRGVDTCRRLQDLLDVPELRLRPRRPAAAGRVGVAVLGRRPPAVVHVQLAGAEEVT